MSYNLSYLICTRNRLPFLRILLPRVLENKLPGEEIVVVDGNSTDGSREYLQQLFDENKIDQFISEPDRNQAHGWNKALLLARGTILKKLIDDDVHDFDAIRKCKKFMLQHQDVDACISDALERNVSNLSKTGLSSRLPWYMNWKAGELKSFTFSDVHLLIRRSSLSYLGLYDTQFIMLDWEYSLRMSYLGARIAYYTGCNAMSVATPGNITSATTQKMLKNEGVICKAKYNYPGDSAGISLYSHLKIAVGKLIYSFISRPHNHVVLPPEDELKRIYSGLYKELIEYNSSTDHKIIC